MLLRAGSSAAMWMHPTSQLRLLPCPANSSCNAALHPVKLAPMVSDVLANWFINNAQRGTHPQLTLPSLQAVVP